MEYALTPLSRSLHEIVKQLFGWAAEHHEEIRAHRARVAETAAAGR